MTSIRIAVVGLGFGRMWAGAYSELPGVAQVGICDPDPVVLTGAGEDLGIERRHASLDEVLESDYDAVHLVTPIPLHVEQSIRVLEAGKHCACAIPMALSLAEVERVLTSQRRSGRIYMLMETEVASPAFLYVQGLYRQGAFGQLQLLRGVHYQNMEGWPDYWRGLPPMYYCYHGLGPLLHLTGSRVAAVQCRGSGRLPDDEQQYGSPFTVESALLELEHTDVICEMTASFHRLARGFLNDRFCVYGDLLSYESPQVAGEDPVLFEAERGPLKPGQRSRAVKARRVRLPPLDELAPSAIAPIIGASQHKRGLLLAHEFVTSILEGREPLLDVETAANWTAAGICAHLSAMNGGEKTVVPGLGPGSSDA